jgi:uncharacterized protein YxeA
MKKIIALSLALVITFTVSACQTKKANPHEGHTPHVHADGSTHYH